MLGHGGTLAHGGTLGMVKHWQNMVCRYIGASGGELCKHSDLVEIANRGVQ